MEFKDMLTGKMREWGYSQRQMAEYLGTSSQNVSRWLAGAGISMGEYRRVLMRLTGKEMVFRENGFTHEPSPASRMPHPKGTLPAVEEITIDGVKYFYRQIIDLQSMEGGHTAIFLDRDDGKYYVRRLQVMTDEGNRRYYIAGESLYPEQSFKWWKPTSVRVLGIVVGQETAR